MDRRSLLVGCAGFVGGLAGCNSTPEPVTTTEPTVTTQPTQTETATSHSESTTGTAEWRLYRPHLLNANLVSTWSEPGDVAENRIESIPRGQPAVIAFRYAVRLESGSFRFREGVEMLGPDGALVDRINEEVKRTTEESGVHTWEHAVAFETAGWPTGEFTAVVRVGNLELHRVSDPFSVPFEIVERS